MENFLRELNTIFNVVLAPLETPQGNSFSAIIKFSWWFFSPVLQTPKTCTANGVLK